MKGKSTSTNIPTVYGGQAVIEGVMIRGRYYYALAVRQSSGNIATYWSRVNTFLSGSLRDIPLIRGIIVLIETLLIGIDSLNRSANMALEEEGQSLSRWSLISMMGFSLSFGIGLFFLLPLLIARSMDGFILSDGLSSGLEGLLRLAIFIAYIPDWFDAGYKESFCLSRCGAYVCSCL